jgi:hypothetical protein
LHKNAQGLSPVEVGFNLAKPDAIISIPSGYSLGKRRGATTGKPFGMDMIALLQQKPEVIFTVAATIKTPNGTVALLLV